MTNTNYLLQAVKNENIYSTVLPKMREISPSYRNTPDNALRKSFSVVIDALRRFWEQGDEKELYDWGQMRARMAIDLEFCPSDIFKALDMWTDAIQAQLRQEVLQKDLLQDLLHQLEEVMRLMRSFYLDAHYDILKKTQDDLTKQTAVIEASNRVFQKALTCESDVDVAEVCLNVAVELTNSQFGYIGELNQAIRFDTIAQSDLGWKACQIPESKAKRLIKDMELQSFWGEIIQEGNSQIVNDPNSHPKSTGTPKGHPLITSFLGVPLKRGEKTIGLIGLANKDGGYKIADQQAIKQLSVAFVQALDRKRTEEKIRLYQENLEKMIDERTSELQQQKDLLQVTLSSIGDAVIATDINAKITFINPMAETLTGWTTQEAQGQEISKIFHIINENTRQTVENPIDRVLKEGEVVGLANHTVLIARDGKEIPIDDSGAPIRNEDGTLFGVVLVFRDITERKKLEEEKLRTKVFLERSLASTPDGVLLLDKEGRFSYVNPPFLKWLGRKRENFINKTVPEISPPIMTLETTKIIAERSEKRLKTGEPIVGAKVEIIDKNNEPMPVSYSAAGIKDDKGDILGEVVFLKDITQQKQAEEKLTKLTEKLQSIIESVPIGLSLSYPKQDLIEANFTAAEILGFESKEEYLKTNVDNLYFDLKDKQRFYTLFEETKGHVKDFEARFKQKDDTIIWLSVTTTIQTIQNEQIIISAFQDITKRKEMEEKLKQYSMQMKERLHNIFEISRDAIGFATLDGRIIDANQALLDMLDYTKKEIQSCTFREFTPKKWEVIENEIIENQVMKQGFSDVYEKELFRKDGTVIPIEIRVGLLKDKDGNPEQMFWIIRDITERKQAEEELKRKEKMAVLGQLAGGVGHELRNPLGAIKNAVYLLNMIFEKPEAEVKESLQIIEEEIATSERTINSLLDFARPRTLAKQKINLNDVIQKALVRTSIPAKIEVITQFNDILPMIIGDPDKLTQVFANIILNAIQAMPEGGHLIIKSGIANQDFVAVSFEDSGEGISKENVERLFKPLFTTKAKGIGLGLAVSKTLVEQHEGTISVNSEFGKGSIFTVSLPQRTE